jgi:transposase
MMGIKARAFAPLCNRSLEELVPADSFYRRLDAKLDLAFVRELVRDTYKEGGRPSIDPVVFFRLQLVLFFEGLRSERELVRVAADRLSIRWYLGYDLDEALPDHSSLTRIRQRYGLAVFRRFFESIVEQCRAAGLVWGQELYVDATQVRANASLDSRAPRFAVEAHLSELFGDDTEAEPTELAPAVDSGTLVELPIDRSGAAQEALAQQNLERHDWLDRIGRPDRTVHTGSYRRRSDFETSRTDPDAVMMIEKKGGLRFGYHDHYVVDGGKARVILEVLVTPADVMENQPFLDLIWRARSRWRLRPRQVTGDTAYGTVEAIVGLEDQGIRAYAPLADWDHRTPYYGPSLFSYEPEYDRIRCPNGQVLRRRSADYGRAVVLYQADAAPSTLTTSTACEVTTTRPPS